MSKFKPISFDDLDISPEDMEKIAAGARAFLDSNQDDDEFVPDLPEVEDVPPEAPSPLVTRRDLRE